MTRLRWAVSDSSKTKRPVGWTSKRMSYRPHQLGQRRPGKWKDIHSQRATCKTNVPLGQAEALAGPVPDRSKTCTPIRSGSKND